MKVWSLLTIFLSPILLAQMPAMKLDRPLREISIIATENGYYPKAVSVHQGENVRLFVTSTHKTPDCVVLQGHPVFMAAEAGKISEKDVVFKDAGRFKFYCPSSKHFGFITVIEKAQAPVLPAGKAGRDVAGSSDMGHWVPKDY